MYSVVLMMALSGGADVPALGHRHHGCCGGYASSSCYGSSCSGWSEGSGGCYGSACYGSCHGGRHHHHQRHHGCHGCHGSCYGSSCYGSSYGACYGSSYGSSWGGCSGSYGSTSGGCSGGSVIMEGGHEMDGHHDGHHHDMDADHEGKHPEKVKEPKEKGKGEEAYLAAPATLVVSVPADAKLMIDDYTTKSTSSVRTFTSPALETGKVFQYTLKAEITRDGKPVTSSKQVSVRAGDQINVALDFSSVAVAQR